MIVNLLDTDYCTGVENYITDIEDNYKYLDSYRMSFESSILLKESFSLEELNEAAGDYWSKFKAKIKAFLTAIKELWDKFWTKIENKVIGDNEWLKEYKGSLKSIKVPKLDYTMYGYFEPDAESFRARLLGDRILPSYNPNDTKFFESLESAEKFRETYLKKFIVKDMKFNEGVKYLSRGKMKDPKSYSGEVISSKIETMITYCENYPKLARTLQAEKNNLERDLNRISRDIDKIKVNESEKNEEKKVEESFTTFKSAIENYGAHILIEGDSYTGLPISERLNLLNEEGGVKISGETDKEKLGAVKRNKQGEIGSVDKEVKDNDTKETIAKRYSVYMTEVYNFIGIRMTIAEEVYTTYMQILKYLGKEFTKKDKQTTKDKETQVEKEKEEKDKDTADKENPKKDVIDKAKEKIKNFASLFKGK